MLKCSFLQHHALLYNCFFSTHLVQWIQMQFPGSHILGGCSPPGSPTKGHSCCPHNHCPHLPSPWDPWWHRVGLDTISESSGRAACVPRLQGEEVTHTDGFPMMLNPSYPEEDGQGGQVLKKRRKHTGSRIWLWYTVNSTYMNRHAKILAGRGWVLWHIFFCL